MCKRDPDQPDLNYRLISPPLELAAAVHARASGIKTVKAVPSDRDYLQFMNSLRSGSIDLASRLANGEMEPRMWADLFKMILNDGHTGSWVLGRQRAGDFAGETIDDTLIGIGFADGQSDFLLKFVDDIVSGRYTDENGAIDASKIIARSDYYLYTMRGTAGASFVAVSDQTDEMNWTLGGVEDHCDDCPYMEEQNPWLPDEIFAHPGDGNTACLFNCKCHWQRASDGLTSFKPFLF